MIFSREVFPQPLGQFGEVRIAGYHAAAGPHQAHELASSDIQINALQSHHLSAPPVKHLAHAGNTELAASGAAMFCTRNHLPPASFAMVNCSSAASGTTSPPTSGTSFINPA